MYDESHYLLSTRVVTDDATVSADMSHAPAESDARQLVFDISGSTGNVYQVTLERNGDRVDTHCTCPDADNYAARYAVACKHCCFVICRVLRQSVQNADSMRTLPLRMWSRMAHRATLLTRHWHERSRRLAPGLVNETFLERYRSRMQKRKERSQPIPTVVGSKTPSEADESEQREQLAAFGVITAADFVAKQTERQKSSASSDADDRHDEADEDDSSDDETDCAVCFEPLCAKKERDSDKQLIRCGECGNCAHRLCIDEWVRIGKHEDCVYCRALLPYALWLQAARDTKTSKRARRQDSDDNATGGSGGGEQQYLNVAACDCE